MALLSDESLFIQNYYAYLTDCFLCRKGKTSVTAKKGISHTHVDLPALVLVDVTRVCLPVGKSKVLLAAVYKSPGWAWSDADITELFGFWYNSLLAGDVNIKHYVWNSEVSGPSSKKLLKLFDNNDFQNSASQCPTHYTPDWNGSILDIMVQWHVQLSDVFVSDVLYSDHLPVIFHKLDHTNTKDFLAPVETLIDWEQFWSLASDIISPRIQWVCWWSW